MFSRGTPSGYLEKTLGDCMTYNNFHYMVLELIDTANKYYSLTDEQIEYLAEVLWNTEEVLVESN